MIEPIVAQDAVVSELGTVLSGTTVIENDPEVTPYVNGEIAEYAFIDFGSPVATYNGRGITGEAKQPFNIRTAIGYVAGSRTAARAGASKIAAGMTGFVPSSNDGPLRLVGGASYTLQEDGAKPLRYVAETFFVFVSNMDVEP